MIKYTAGNYKEYDKKRKDTTIVSEAQRQCQATPPCLLSIASPAEPVPVYRRPPGRRIEGQDTASSGEHSGRSLNQRTTSHARPSLLPLPLFLLHRCCLYQARPGHYTDQFLCLAVSEFRFLTDLV